MKVIRCEGLGHIYNKGMSTEKKALDDINIEINEGELLGIIGHTGSGKSTLIQHFNGLLKPTHGKVYVDETDIWENPKGQKNICFKVGLVFQYPEYQLFEETVYKDIAFGPKNMGLSESEIDEQVRKAADFVGLHEKYLDKSPFELSGGQKRRVAIAGIIAMTPRVLILDEPAAGLDPKSRERILEQIKSYGKISGATIIIVSHSMEDVAKFANKIIVMNNSKIAMYDSADKIFARSDELISMRLSVPQVTKIFMELKNAGFAVDTNVYTVEYAKNQLLRYFGHRGSSC